MTEPTIAPPAIGDSIVDTLGNEIGVIVEVLQQFGRTWRVIADHGHENVVMPAKELGTWTVGPS